ncbi:thioesterase family protein [Microbacterium sp.]|uniref:thioesterase family protein n=1 Tax=Microbacterium sp. TaxID=51671 RepID=UPI003A924299
MPDSSLPPAYFRRLSPTRFLATAHVGGAWNPDEQHIAPALGLVAHLIEQEHRARRDDGMQLARVSYDILGVMPIDVMDTAVRVLRPGRTVELVEAVVRHANRPALVARAWWMTQGDTAALAGSDLPPMPPRESLDEWSAGETWPGGFVTTVQTRRRQERPGRAWSWLRPLVPLVAGEDASTTARALGVVDILNGVTVRVPPAVALYPNIDLTVHLFRPPRFASPEEIWVGADTTVSFGETGMGLTHSVLHDEHGPIGTVDQALTVRPL